MILKYFFAGLIAGLLLGTSSGVWIANARHARQELRQQAASLQSAQVEQRDLQDIGAQFEARRETIETQTEGAAHELDTHLLDRPDLRTIDLGAQWLCITDRAAGRASARCAAEPAAPVPGAAADQQQPVAGHAASVPTSSARTPHLPRTPRIAGSSGEAAAGGARGDQTDPTQPRD